MYSTAQFKSNFSPGDVICRDRMGRPCLVTAIGTKRFLFRSLCGGNDERVAMIYDIQSKWRRWDPSRYPDSHYVYVMEKDFKKDRFHPIEMDINFL